MKAAVLYEALAVLRAVKDLPCTGFPAGLSWHRVMSAHNALEYALMQQGLTVPVEAPQTQEVTT